MYRGRRVAIAIPAHNEELLIGDTLDGLPALVDGAYVTDDCSSDRTSEVVKGRQARDDRIHLNRHATNGGVGAAIKTAYAAALADGHDLIVVMAGDDQMDPAALPALLDPLVDGTADFTKADRLVAGHHESMSAWRLTGNHLLSILSRFASGYWFVRDPQNGYVAITADALDRMGLDRLADGYVFENDMMLEARIAGLRLANVPVQARYGQETSGIQYLRFIPRTSWHLLRSYLGRIARQFLRRPSAAGLGYAAAALLLLSALVTLFVIADLALPLVAGGILAFLAGIGLDVRADRREGASVHLEDRP
ncbi:MAG: glycosyltransferase family 2 protein [Thermoplasmatota archaeon]